MLKVERAQVTQLAELSVVFLSRITQNLLNRFVPKSAVRTAAT